MGLDGMAVGTYADGAVWPWQYLANFLKVVRKLPEEARTWYARIVQRDPSNARAFFFNLARACVFFISQVRVLQERV